MNGRNSPPYEKIDEDNPHLYDSADQEGEERVGAYEMPRSSAERSVSPQVHWGREGGREGGMDGRREEERERERERERGGGEGKLSCGSAVLTW